MTRYIQYTASDGGTILMEVAEQEVASPEGVVKAGVADAVQKTVARAHASFEGALDRVVRQNAQALIHSVRGLTESPDELEVTFGLKATGEVGNIAIAKGGGEANFTIKLSWKRGEEK